MYKRQHQYSGPGSQEVADKWGIGARRDGGMFEAYMADVYKRQHYMLSQKTDRNLTLKKTVGAIYDINIMN